MIDKSELRSRVLEWRQTLDTGRVRTWSEAIARQVLALPELRDSARLVAYVGVRNEVGTEFLVRALLARGVEVAVPRVVGPGKMVPAPLRAWEDLVPGRFRIPTSSAEPWSEMPRTVLVPGVAFDRSLRRLGYGGGFYDRFLGPEQQAIALCFEGQLVETVPVEPHDRVMDVVVTEQQVLR